MFCDREVVTELVFVTSIGDLSFHRKVPGTMRNTQESRSALAGAVMYLIWWAEPGKGKRHDRR